MKKTISFFSLILLMTYTSFAFTEKESNKVTVSLETSIINLISNPGEYHGKRIRIKGFALIRHEGTAIYLSENDAKHSIYKNAVWLRLGDDYVKHEKYHRKYVEVEGIFDKTKGGHLGSTYSGTVEKIEKIELLPTWWDKEKGIDIDRK